MDIFLIILGVLLFAGRVGRLFFACITRSACFLCGFVAFALYGQNPFQYYTFDFRAFLVIIVQVMDYVTPMLGTKYSGGGKWGSGMYDRDDRRSFSSFHPGVC